METAKSIKALFDQLPVSVQQELLDELLQQQELKGQVLQAARDELSQKQPKKPCPHCKNLKVQKRGKQNGVQMYRCNACTKWFSETTGTPLWDIKLKHKWQAYLRCMEQGMSIKKIAKEINISIQTSFDWRHKILSALKELAPEQLSQTVEVDELELPLSQKGSRHLTRKPRHRADDFVRNEFYDDISTVQVVTAVQRGGSKFLAAVESKRLSQEQIEKALEGKFAPNTTLITDKHKSYAAFAKSNANISHYKTVLAKEHVSKEDKSVHLQHVNNTHSQLRTFLRPFNGVSSKYLQNYLNWFAYANQLKQSKHTLKMWFLTMLISPKAYELFLLFKNNAVIIRT